MANKHLVLFVLKNKTGETKLGVSVSKKVGKSVVRNRVRRLIKESYRLLQGEVRPGYDLVVIARQPANTACYDEISGGVRQLLRRQSLLLHAAER